MDLNTNELFLILDSTNLRRPLVQYDIILNSKDSLLITESTYTPNLDRLYQIRNNNISICNTFDLFFLLESTIRYKLILIHNFMLNDFEIEMLRIYCKKYSCTILIFNKKYKIFDYKMIYKNNKYFVLKNGVEIFTYNFLK